MITFCHVNYPFLFYRCVVCCTGSNQGARTTALCSPAPKIMCMRWELQVLYPVPLRGLHGVLGVHCPLCLQVNLGPEGWNGKRNTKAQQEAAAHRQVFSLLLSRSCLSEGGGGHILRECPNSKPHYNKPDQLPVSCLGCTESRCRQACLTSSKLYSSYPGLHRAEMCQPLLWQYSRRPFNLTKYTPPLRAWLGLHLVEPSPLYPGFHWVHLWSGDYTSIWNPRAVSLVMDSW